MIQRTLLIRGVIIAIVFLVGWVIFISSKQLERNQRIQDEVSALQREAVQVRRENETLADKISYFSSSDFREQEAKRKLGLKKAPEAVVVIKQAPAARREEENSPDAVQETPRESEKASLPNYAKWWNIFFR